MASNADIEMQWVDAWERLYKLVEHRLDVPCQLPDLTIVDVDTCKGWLQRSVYEGFEVSLNAGWIGHKQGVLASRYRPGEKS